MALETSYLEKHWQNTLSGSKNKLNALFHDGYISDLTISFLGKEIKYKALKAILAMASPIFEKMLFGPMAITGSELELSDNDPKAFKIVLAHCYEVNIEPSDIDEAIEVYLLADKYFLEKLKGECSSFISNIISSDNINELLEYSTNFKFDWLKKACCNSLMLSSQKLLGLSREWIKELLESGELVLNKLIFKESWEYPNEILDDNAIIQILKSKSCRIEGLINFAGCVSAEVVRYISWATDMDIDSWHHMCISIINAKQVNDILRVLDETRFDGFVHIHFQCYVIQPEALSKVPISEASVSLLFSEVDDNAINWVISIISSLRNDKEVFGIYFPKSELTISGFEKMIREIATLFKNHWFAHSHIYICSPNVPSDKEQYIRTGMRYAQIPNDKFFEIKIYDTQDIMFSWDL